MNSVKVSVIVPSLNVAEYISDCLESIINQTLKDIEILCVDASSTDGTLEIINSFAAKDKRIKVLISEKKSYGYQVNLGIKNASGEYIGIVESDDIVNIQMFKELYEVASKNMLDVVKTDFGRFVIQNKEFKLTEDKICKVNMRLYNKVLGKTDYSAVIKDAQLYIWAGIYRTEFLRKFDIRCNESLGASYQDNGFWFLTMTLAEKVMFIDKLGYMLRRDNPNSSFYRKDKAFVIFDEYNFVKNELLRLNMFDSVASYFYNAYCGAVRWHYRRIADEQKFEFLDKWKNEFQEPWNNNLIDETVFSRTLYNDLVSVLETPERFYKKEKRLEKRKSKARNLFNLVLWSLQDRGIKKTFSIIKQSLKKAVA